MFTEVYQGMLLTMEVTVWIFGRIINEKCAALKLTGLGICAYQYCPERSLVFSSHCQVVVRYFP